MHSKKSKKNIFEFVFTFFLLWYIIILRLLDKIIFCDKTGEFMKEIKDEEKLFSQILALISTHFGNDCEVVLHDLTRDYNHTIVDIRNGHVTNRKIDDCGSNLGLEILRGNVVDGDRFNYVTHTADGRILRSSSIYITDDNNKVIGSLCINSDITETVHFEGYLKQYNQYNIGQEEVFVHDVNDVLEFLIKQGQIKVGKSADQMTKREKLEFLGYLDSKGALLITKSGDRICELLNISKFTLYNYLETVRSKKVQSVH